MKNAYRFVASDWYHFVANAADPSVVDLHIVDFIGDWIDDYFGFGVTAKAIIDQLSQLPPAVSTIRVHINSPGGDVQSAINIANALRDQRATQHRTVETIVDGLAASAASVILMAGDPVRMADNGLVMIHNPQVAGMQSTEFRNIAGAMDKMREQIVATYQWHSKLSTEDLIALMDATTWLTASEAVDKGFATEIVQGLKAAALLPASAIAGLTIPDKHRALVAAFLKPAPPAPPVTAKAAEVLALVEGAGLSTAVARELIEAALPLETVQARVIAAKTEKAQAEGRAREIRALCVTAKLEDLADGYVSGGMPLAAVKAHLTTITAWMDKAEIDAGLPTEQHAGARPRVVLNTAKIYERFNAPYSAQRTHGG
jgi:ATP-dependent protease ClpP protease subunit